MNAKYVLVFTAGFISGAAVAATYLKDRFSQIAQEEIDAIKEVYSDSNERKKESGDQDEAEEDVKGSYASSLTKYQTKVEDAGYTNYHTSSEEPKTAKKPVKKTVKKKDSKITYIDPNEFGDDLDYEQINLTYYADGVMADDADEVMDEIEINGTVGENFEDHFGEFEGDTVYVKNDARKVYYEVCRDSRDSSEVLSKY